MSFARPQQLHTAGAQRLELTGRMVYEFLHLVIHSQVGEPFGLVRNGIGDALGDYTLSVGDNLEFHEADLADLSEAAAMLDHDFLTISEDSVLDQSSVQSIHSGHRLAVLENEYRRDRDGLMRRLKDLYLHIGYCTYWGRCY